MNKLLPPLASDISGVLSICKLMNLEPIVYTPGGCDAPHRKLNELDTNYSYLKTRFDDLDFNFGTEDKLIASINALDTNKDIILISTPLTEMVGADYSSIVLKSNKPVFHIKTNGFKDYKSGIKAFFKSKNLFNSAEMVKNKIQIVGFTELAYGSKELLNPLIGLLKSYNFDLELLGSKNLYKDGEYSLILNPESDNDFQNKIYGYPIGEYGVYKLLNSLGLNYKYDKCPNKRDEKVLIIGEYTTSLALAKSFENDFGFKNIEILSLKSELKSAKNNPNFTCDKAISSIEETDLQAAISKSDILVADVLFSKLYKLDEKIFIPVPYVGLSGRYFSNIKYSLIGQDGLDYFKKFI